MGSKLAAGCILALLCTCGPASASTEYLRFAGTVAPGVDLSTFPGTGLVPGQDFVLDFAIDLDGPGFIVLPSGETDVFRDSCVEGYQCFSDTFYSSYLGGPVIPSSDGTARFFGYAVLFPEGPESQLMMGPSLSVGSTYTACFHAEPLCSSIRPFPQASGPSFVDSWQVGQPVGLLWNAPLEPLPFFIPMTLVYRDIVPVPGPSPLLLLGTACLALGGRLRRRPH